MTFIRVPLEAATAIVADNVVQSGRVQNKSKVAESTRFSTIAILESNSSSF